MKNYFTIESAIHDKINADNLIGIIPISPINLKIRFTNFSIKNSVLLRILEFLIIVGLVIQFVVFLSTIRDLISGTSVLGFKIYSFIALIIMTFIFYLIYSLCRWIFKIPIKLKYYPIFILTKNKLYFSVFKKNKNNFDDILFHQFDIPYSALSNNLYGEIINQCR